MFDAKSAGTKRESDFFRRLRKITFLAVALTASAAAAAANYPLELVSPRAAGTVPSSEAGTPAMPQGHRIFKAYPGIEYNIRAVVIGGAYPYSFSLSNAPTGMTIDPRTGEIAWPNPQANATPMITVTDSEGLQRSSPWTITVTTDGFYFVDAVNGSDGNAGTRGVPWRTLLKVYDSSSLGQVIYFRQGEYNLNGIPKNTAGDLFGAWNNTNWVNKANIWIAYPGEIPTIDHGFTAPGSNQTTGYNIRIGGNALYIDGIKTINYGNMSWQAYNGAYMTWRNLVTEGPLAGVDQGNPGSIMFMATPPSYKWYVAIQDSLFFHGTAHHLKTYTLHKFLIEDNIFRDGAQGFDIKADIYRYEVRGNKFVNLTLAGVDGNFAANPGMQTSDGEIRYNLFNVPSAPNGAIYSGGPPVYIYRNTIVGDVLNTISTGTITMYQNVIVNALAPPTKSRNAWFVSGNPTWDLDGPGISGGNTNLTGFRADGIVDSNGNLTSGYLGYLGTRGYQIGGATIAPSPPANLLVQ